MVGIQFYIFIAYLEKMLLKRVSLLDRLEQVRSRQTDEETLLSQVKAFLAKDAEQEGRIQETLARSKPAVENLFDFDALESDRIYHVSHIRQICINYRLRFLDTNYFKGSIPREGLQKIKELENIHGIELQGFKIVAPSRLFRLEDKNDPLLFAPIGNGYYYLVHKWGNDLHPLRRIIAWPLKSVMNALIVLALLSYLLTALIPEGLFSKQGSTAEFWIIYFFMFKSVAAVAIFYGFALGKNFSPAVWNSKYFNA